MTCEAEAPTSVALQPFAPSCDWRAHRNPTWLFLLLDWAKNSQRDTGMHIMPKTRQLKHLYSPLSFYAQTMTCCVECRNGSTSHQRHRGSASQRLTDPQGILLIDKTSNLRIVSVNRTCMYTCRPRQLMILSPPLINRHVTVSRCPDCRSGTLNDLFSVFTA